MAVGIAGIWADDAKVVVIAAILAASGMMMVILNDNAKTRRLIRLTARDPLPPVEHEGPHLTRLS